MSKTLKGSLSISMPIGGGADGNIELSVEDDGSACKALKISIDPADFAKALMSRLVPCVFSINESGKIGTRREIKRVALRPPEGSGYGTVAQRMAAMKPHEIDGWIGRENDLRNDHNRNADGSFNVLFERWV